MQTPIVSDDGQSAPDASGVTPDRSSEKVAYETYSKVLGQKKAQDTTIRELTDKLARFEAAEKDKQEAQLRAEKKHDEIIAALKAENAELVGRLGKVQSDIMNSMKLQALERETGGFAHPEYARFAQLEKIALTEDGNIDNESLVREATRIREAHPHLLKQATPALPTGAPASAVVTPKPQQLTDRERYNEQIKQRLGVSL